MITIENVAIAGVATSVPSAKIENIQLADIYGDKETEKLISSTGVNTRRIAGKSLTASEMCYHAACDLLDKLKWDTSSIGALIFVSQTPDHQLPATACILQNKLGLPTHTIAYDVNLGCSGYVYGLFLASSLVQTGIQRVLLLVGDTISQLVKPGDRSTELLFGDAGSATAIEHDACKKLSFELGSDGHGAEHIMARKLTQHQDTNIEQSSAFLTMNGGEVFSFTLKRIPKLVNDFMAQLSLDSDDIDACIYHQANRFMLRHLAKKSKFPPEKVPLSIMDYGNTSCASIPVTLCSQDLINRQKSLLVGFGVGLSWGVVYADLSQTQLLPIREIAGE